jgi:hypothetical protein
VAGLIAGLLLFASCGDSDEHESSGTVACDGTPLEPDAIALPADFPIPEQVTLTASAKQGPSRTADGYFEGSVEGAYHAWKDAFDAAGYTVLFDELEDRDSEVSYQAADRSSTGQVMLKSDCEERGRTDLHITNRPA